MPPGPALSALLAGLDLAALPDSATIDVLRASWRQVSHAYAQHLSAMAEAGSRSDPAWAACEIEAALTFTGRRADYEHTFAQTVVQRLPLVLDALRRGEIDLHKARVFAEHLTDLTDPQIALICRRLLPRAPGWTTGQLAHRLLREIAAVDHHHTRRRYERAVNERGVSEFLAPDGTATMPRTDSDDHDDFYCGRIYDGPILPRGPDPPVPPKRAGPPMAPDDNPPPF